MIASRKSQSEPCPACGASTESLLEAIELAIQHQSYSPKDVTIQAQLTTLAGIPFDSYQMLICGNCGLEFSSPLRAPTEEWYRLVYKVLNLYHSTRWEFDFVAESLHRGDVLGEIGCGSGEFLKRCRRESLVGNVGEDNDRLLGNQNTAAFIVAPNASAARICRGPAVELAERLQDLIDPEVLIDRFSVAVLAGDENNQQRRANGQRGMEDLFRLG